MAPRQLQRETPGDVPALGAPDPEAVRAHWRNKLTELVEVLPTSETALREGMYREANVLPPASSMPHLTKPNKVLKHGARDAAIWMSAVEYARAHPQETVYFVSNNTRQTRLTGYRAPAAAARSRTVRRLTRTPFSSSTCHSFMPWQVLVPRATAPASSTRP